MHKINQIQNLLKNYFALFLSVAFGVFLFILFFQPFPLENFDFNNRLVFIAGFSGIVFILILIIRVLFLLYVKNNQNALIFARGFLIFVLNSAAFAFYLTFVGKVTITFYVMLRVSFICLAVPIVLWLYDLYNHLKLSNILLNEEIKLLQKQVEQFQDNNLNRPIELISENGSDKIELLNAEIAFIRSADNYVEIVYREADEYRKKLIRNTMKGIEHQVKEYSNFIRCHRICIVNTHFIEKLLKINDSYQIIIKGSEEKLPVSRQYLLRLREIT